MNAEVLHAWLRGKWGVVLTAFAALPIIGLLSGCGGSNVIPAGVHKPTTPTPASVVTPASPTPAPAPPVVMITQQGTPQNVVQAMDPSGTPLWSVPYSGVAFYASGPRVFKVDNKAKQVGVFDRTGHPVGNGDGTGAGMVFSPTSAEWAWSAWDGVSPSPLPASGTGTSSGAFWVAGVGEPAHIVYRWTETESVALVQDAFDRLAEWSDQGLVSTEEPPWAGCTSGHQSSSYVVNPSTGARTDLGRDPVVGAHEGVIVSAPRTGSTQTGQSIVLSGRTSFTWTEPMPGKEIPEGVYISPDGARVAIALINLSCAGMNSTLRTAVISVSDHSVQYVPDVLARGWLDPTHLIGPVTWYTSPAQPNQELDVAGLDGTRTLLGHGQLLGVLPPS